MTRAATGGHSEIVAATSVDSRRHSDKLSIAKSRSLIPSPQLLNLGRNTDEKAVNVDCELGIYMRASLREVQAMRCAECYVMVSKC